MLNPVSKSTPRENRTIVVPFDQDKYPEMILKPDKFRASMGKFIEYYPELFPPEICNALFTNFLKTFLVCGKVSLGSASI